MEKTNDIQVPYLKQNALITVEIGTAFVGQLQAALVYLADGHEEDLRELEQKMQNKSELNNWDQAIVCTTNLMQEIMRIAEKTEQIEYKPVESLIPGI